MKLGKWETDLRDVHVYGGILLAALGVVGYIGWQSGLIFIGLALAYIGIYRMGRI